MPEPIITPIRSLSILESNMLELLIASCDAKIVKAVNLSIRFCSFLSIKSFKSIFTSPAIFTENFSVSNEEICEIPLVPNFNDLRNSGQEFPIGETTPIPVTTTLFFKTSI